MKKHGFTMIELVFVIVVLGILAAIAVPRFAATRDDAAVAKGRANVAAIRSGIITERQARLFRGNPAFITAVAMDAGGMFGGVMTYPITDSKWAVTAPGTNYTYTVGGRTAAFVYNPATGNFACGGSSLCAQLTN